MTTRISGLSIAPQTEYIEIDTPPLPNGWTADFSPDVKPVFDLALRLFEMCDVFSNADHNLLRCDNAATLNLGSDVQRMFMTRAYRFNAWGLRSMGHVRSGAASLQTSKATFITEIDDWVKANTSEATTIYDLEIRNAFYEFLMTGPDLARPVMSRAVGAIATVRSQLLVGTKGITPVIDALEVALATFEAQRTNMFKDVAETLEEGGLPTVAWTGTGGIHIWAPIYKVAAIVVMRFLCIVTTSESCKRWDWLEKLKKELRRELRDCQPTEPIGTDA